jgi:hypothetical protein
MNQHDADAVANTHTSNTIIRGKAYTIAAYSEKEAKSFAKHSDFQQSPANDVYVTTPAYKSGYHLIFDETFTQSGKSTPNEVMLVVARDDVGYNNYESDIATDRSLINKMGSKPGPHPKIVFNSWDRLYLNPPCSEMNMFGRTRLLQKASL